MYIQMEEDTVSATKTIVVPIHKLPHAPQNLPQYQTEGAVGMDLQAAITEPITLQPLERQLIPTGFVIMLPEGYEAQIRARSGMSVKHGITLINAIGTIDWDYRNEVKVALVNLSNQAYTIQPEERIAQMVIAPVTKAEWQQVAEVSEANSKRDGGFGSTGK